MDASVFSFRNNSSIPQEFSMFESSALSSNATEFQPVWNFQTLTKPHPKNIYNIASALWWDQTVVASPGSLGIRLYRNDGTTFILGSAIPSDPALQNLTTVGFEAYLNGAPFNQIGTWSIDGPFNDDRGLGEFIIRCIPSADFIAANNISSSSELNYGVQSISLAGSTGDRIWNSMTIFPQSSAVAPSLVSNPNVTIISSTNFPYSDFLWSSIQRTYDIKNFQIFSTNQQQLLEPFIFDRTLATGKVYQKVLTPSIDPYQSQNYIITPEGKGYILDGFTKIRYNLQPLSSVRLILDYTYIDISTPLIAELVPRPIPEHISEPLSEPLSQYIATSPGNYASAPLPEAFTDNMKDGYERFGCKFLSARLLVQKEKLEFLKSKPPGKRNPKWQQFLKDKISYITNKLSDEECEVPEFQMMGDEFRRRNLWMPSPEFVQHQLDTEQGARKLFGKHDFPIEKE